MTPNDDDESPSERARPVRAALPPSTARGWDRLEYQRLWLYMASRKWRTLAIVPAEEGMSTYEVASVIMGVGAHHGASIGLFDFRDVRLHRVLTVVADACEHVMPGERLIFATRSIKENLATIPLARAADGVVLCVSLGSTRISLVEETIEEIGRERFLGSVLVCDPPSRARAPRRARLWRRLEALW
jgi:hypothetical protein